MWISRSDQIRLLEIGFTVFAILFMSGGLTRLLTGGAAEDVARETGSALVQLSGAMVFLLTFVFYAVRARAYTALTIRNAALFVPVLFALASTDWSPEAGLTLRRAISLFGTTMLGLYIALRFDLREIANLLFVTLSAIVCASFAAAVLAPGFGVHQASDPLTGIHAGLWRGLFWHKNALGPLASLLALLVIALWRQIAFGPAIKAGVIGVSAIVVVKTGSAQALFQLCVFVTLMVIHLRFRRARLNVRVAIFFALAALAAIVLPYLDEIKSFGLALLGRDDTLSSRTLIWRAAIAGGLAHPIFGNGYEMGWRGDAALIALQRYQAAHAGNAHNGYLQLWLDLGFVGLGLFLAVVLNFALRVYQVAKVSPDAYILSLYFLLYYLASNYVTAFFLKYQNVYWLLFCILFVMMSKLLHERRRRRPAPFLDRAAGDAAPAG